MSFGWDEIASQNPAAIREKTFPAALSAIEDVFAFLAEQTDCVPADKKNVDALMIIAEELFVNIASYAYDDGGEARIRCCVTEDPSCIHILFADSGTAYDPTKRTAEDAAASLYTLTPGGLGILMVKKMSDGMEYRRADGENQLYIKKLL